jgi:hypothetical protein
VWTSDDSIGVPFERPRRYGDRKQLTDEEYTDRAKENELIASSVQAGVIPNAGYWIEHQGVDAVPYSSNWTEYARHTSQRRLASRFSRLAARFSSNVLAGFFLVSFFRSMPLLIESSPHRLAGEIAYTQWRTTAVTMTAYRWATAMAPSSLP